MVQAVEQLTEVFGVPDHQIELGRAALVLAKLEYPELNIDAYLGRIDEFASKVARRLQGRYDPERIVRCLNEYLFLELGFHGNERDYYDPKNSFLNDVIDRRTGIPISLSVVYLEVARRLGLPFYGVGLPGHFVVKYEDNRQAIYVDPFHAGRILDEQDCQDLVRSMTGNDVQLTAQDFRAVDNRYIMLRMVNNLRGIYLHTGQYGRAVGVLDVIIALLPGSAEGIRERGWLNYELRRLSRARDDLKTYLVLRPDGEDAEEVRACIDNINKSLAMMN